jgi:hypothetical protein
MAYHTVMGVTFDYNYYANVTTPYAFSSAAHEPSCSLGNCAVTSDPFVYSAGGYFHLAAPLQNHPGSVLAAPYDHDMAGIIRGADGVWDRGLYEFSSTKVAGNGRRMSNAGQAGMPACLNPRTISVAARKPGARFYDLRGQSVRPDRITKSGIFLIKSDATVPRRFTFLR